MSKHSRDLPDLGLLIGFEAAARHLSFTLAAREIHRTQSAVSRQIQTLEEQLGVALFTRRTRSLVLTAEGRRLYMAAVEAIEVMRQAVDLVRGSDRNAVVTVTTTVTLASLWLVPRLAHFQSAFPGIEVRLVANNDLQDLDRDGIDVAIRYCVREQAGKGAVRLFGERVLPVASPDLLKRGPRIAAPVDLNRHVLLVFDEEAKFPWFSWSVWFEAMKVPMAKPAGILRFSHYDQLLQAAVGGQGIALGRVPLADALLRSGKLVAPFSPRTHSTSTQMRAYFALRSQRSAGRVEVDNFLSWLRAQVKGIAG